MSPQVGLEIGTAGQGGGDPNQDLSAARFGHRDPPKCDPPGRLKDQGLHGRGRFDVSPDVDDSDRLLVQVRASSPYGTLKPMPTVETSVHIDAPLETVYAVAKDNRSFPEFMSDVKSVTIVESEGGRVVSDWVGVVPTFGLKIRWRQEDAWDDVEHVCDFRQVSGDYDRLEGRWKFTEEDGGTRFDSVLEYEYVVPGLGALVKKVVHSLVVKNMEGVLGAIKKRAEERG